MKRLLHCVSPCVAVLLVSLVVVQPVLAGLLCAVPAGTCPMAITDMGPGCGLGSRMASDASPRIDYVHRVSRSLASVALPASTKVFAPSIVNFPVDNLPEARVSRFLVGQIPAETSSPPIYIRNRVFRI